MQNPSPRVTGSSPTYEETGSDRKRFRASAAHGFAPGTPVILVGSNGAVEYLSPTARRLLDYRPDQTIEVSFFSLIHGRQLYQVMRDVADMVCHGKSKATWLIRLRGDSGRWKWFKAEVFNQGEAEDTLVSVVLYTV